MCKTSKKFLLRTPPPPNTYYSNSQRSVVEKISFVKNDLSEMASKYRNLIAAQVRQIAAARGVQLNHRCLVQPMTLDCDLSRRPQFGVRLPVGALGTDPHGIVEAFETDEKSVTCVAVTGRRKPERPVRKRGRQGLFLRSVIDTGVRDITF